MDQAVTILNGRMDFTSKDLAESREGLRIAHNSVRDMFNEVAVFRSDLERNVAACAAHTEHMAARHALKHELSSVRAASVRRDV